MQPCGAGLPYLPAYGMARLSQAGAGMLCSLHVFSLQHGQDISGFFAAKQRGRTAWGFEPQVMCEEEPGRSGGAEEKNISRAPSEHSYYAV